jgi:hypothetical protein
VLINEVIPTVVFHRADHKTPFYPQNLALKFFD